MDFLKLAGGVQRLGRREAPIVLGSIAGFLALDGVLFLFAPAVALLLVGALIYFIPTILAGALKHRYTGTILVLNLFLGWTVLGWVLALIWAVPHEQRAG